jgi:hypothetical protein
MWIEFDQLPEDARIWIFSIPGDVDLSLREMLNTELKSFIQEWTSHDRSLKASAAIIDNRFIIVGLDQSQYGASGCSIDKLLRLIQNLEIKTGLHLLLKNKIAIQNQDVVQWKTIQEIKHSIESGILDDTSVYFDTMIDTMYLYKHEWIKPIKKGWLGKKLNN